MDLLANWRLDIMLCRYGPMSVTVDANGKVLDRFPRVENEPDTSDTQIALQNEHDDDDGNQNNGTNCQPSTQRGYSCMAEVCLCA